MPTQVSTEIAMKTLNEIEMDVNVAYKALPYIVDTDMDEIIMRLQTVAECKDAMKQINEIAANLEDIEIASKRARRILEQLEAIIEQDTIWELEAEEEAERQFVG